MVSTLKPKAIVVPKHLKDHSNKKEINFILNRVKKNIIFYNNYNYIYKLKQKEHEELNNDNYINSCV